MIIGQRDFDLENKTYIMGILNVTPDSFSDGGHYHEVSAAVERALCMEEEGASIIDIGGESTRPGYRSVEAQEEIERLLPVIEGIRKYSQIPISIDTSKAVVARATLQLGGDMINDIWGFKKDEAIAQVVAEFKVPCCLMHNRDLEVYESLLMEVCADLRESINIAKHAGIDQDQIIIDPGIGFAKTLAHNVDLMTQLEVLKTLGYPMLLGTSRKSLIGRTLQLPVTERLEGTLATTVFGIMKGCSIIRVHDVKENVRAAKMADILLGRERETWINL